MFNSTILDVAIGLAFTFLAVSLATGAIVEAINSLFKLRSSSLLRGIQQLFNDPNFDKMALKLYQHAAVHPRGPGAPATGPKDTDQAKADAKTRAPAYIDPEQFANAMVDILGLSAASAGAPARGPAAVAAFTAAINTALTGAPPQIKDFLISMVQRTEGDLYRIQAELADWFDASMDRLSGAFKRRTQLFSVVIALAMCVTLNIDSFAVSQALWAQPKLAEELKLSPDLLKLVQAGATPEKPSTDAMAAMSASETTALAALSGLSQLPLGWPEGRLLHIPKPADAKAGTPHVPTTDDDFLWFWEPKTAPQRILGWVVTALATLFGAPFWFDLLQTFTRVKGAGPSPAEKKARIAASA